MASATRETLSRSLTSSLIDAVHAAARISQPPHGPIICTAALKRGTSSFAISSPPSTPRVTAATAKKTTAAMAIPPKIENAAGGQHLPHVPPIHADLMDRAVDGVLGEPLAKGQLT